MIFTNISWLTSKDFFVLIFLLLKLKCPNIGTGLTYLVPWIPAEALGVQEALPRRWFTEFFLGKGLRCRKTKAPCSLKHEHGGGFEYFVLSSLPGEMIEFDDHIFQMG